MKNHILSLLCAFLLLACVTAFAPPLSTKKQSTLSFRPARFVPAGKVVHIGASRGSLRMAEEGKDEEGEGATTTETPQTPQGTFYDDEVRNGFF